MKYQDIKQNKHNDIRRILPNQEPKMRLVLKDYQRKQMQLIMSTCISMPYKCTGLETNTDDDWHQQTYS